MRQRLFYFLLTSIILVTFYFIYDATIDRTPSSNPFKINPNITFKSIVKNGFSYDNNECGFLMYSKKSKDTIIHYDVYIDYDYRKDDEYQENYAFLNSDKNPYRPYDIDKISNCYQKIPRKIYRFKIGDSLNLKKIKAFIAKNGAVITSEEWHKFNSGTLTVYNPKENISFDRYIQLRDELEGGKWYFKYIKKLPNNFIDNIYQGFINWLTIAQYVICITSFLLFSFLIVKILKSKKKTFYKWNLLIFVIYLILFLYYYFSPKPEYSEVFGPLRFLKLHYITKLFYIMIFHFALILLIRLFQTIRKKLKPVTTKT